uniref:Transposase n=1 Tax=Acrobeloides nanus TaxID=290746 RepID=A0A914CX54_9BILA
MSIRRVAASLGMKNSKNSSYVRFRRRVQKEPGERTQRTPKNIDAVKATINQKGMSIHRVAAGLGMKNSKSSSYVRFCRRMRKETGERTQRTPKNIDAMKAVINQKGMSVHCVAAGLGMKKDSVHRILKKIWDFTPISFKCYRSWKRMIPKSEWYSLKSSLNIWNMIKISSKICFSPMKPIFTFTKVMLVGNSFLSQTNPYQHLNMVDKKETPTNDHNIHQRTGI